MPIPTFDPARFKMPGKATKQYRRQLERLAADGKQVDCIEQAVDGAIGNLNSKTCASFVIYGEPQSGKTEMMICLTARLLDEGRLFILHLLNDSVDLFGSEPRPVSKIGTRSSRCRSRLLPANKRYYRLLEQA